MGGKANKSFLLLAPSCLEYMGYIICLFSLLKLFLGSPYQAPDVTKPTIQMGRLPKGKEGLLVLRTDRPLAKVASLTSWAFVEWSVWRGHSVGGSHVPSNAVAVISECSPPRVENGLEREKCPCRIAQATTGEWDKGISICT